MEKITKQLGEILNKRSDVNEWAVTGIKSDRRELYLIGEETEQLRAVEEQSYSAHVYCDKEIDGVLKRGHAIVHIPPREANEESAVNEMIDQAVFAAGLGLNEHYTLDDFIECDRSTAGYDTRAAEDLTGTVEKMAQKTIQLCRAEEDVYLASSEVFMTKSETVMRNSRGLFDHNLTTNCMYELAVGSQKDSDVETHLWKNERLIRNIGLEDCVKNYSQYCRDNAVAELPPSGKFDVIFADESFETLFNYFVFQSFAANKYVKMINNEIGDQLIPQAAGDTITLSFDPYLSGGKHAIRYDHYGTLLQKHTPIKDGVLVKYMADKRFGGYLGYDVTGTITNVVVEPGTTSFEDMKTEGSLILSRFSTFSPNAVTGTFSAEIRNGLLVKDGKLVPVKRGSISGNLKDVFANATLSKETFHYGDYFGPAYVKVGPVTCAGA